MPDQPSHVYFASDFHLGVPDAASSLKREKKLVNWLDSIKKKAASVYLMGDVFDFWFEYKTVVPKGYVRLLGKLAELSDHGVEIHLFCGNHDVWAFSYLKEELNIQIYRKPTLANIMGKTFFLAHGDGLGPGDHGYKLLKKVFGFKPNQWLFKWLHPDIGTRLGLYFSGKSRLANMARMNQKEDGTTLEKERLYLFAKAEAQQQPNVDYFIFGHRHLPIHTQLNPKAELFILGDWIHHFTFVEFDGKTCVHKTFKNGTAEVLETDIN